MHGLGLALVRGAIIGSLISYGLEPKARDLKQNLKEGAIAGLALGALAFFGGQLALVGGVIGVAVCVMSRRNVISRNNVFEGAVVGILTGTALSLLR